jgi:hypothetical protein
MAGKLAASDPPTEVAGYTSDPGDPEWPGALDDLGDATPAGTGAFAIDVVAHRGALNADGAAIALGRAPNRLSAHTPC